MVAQHGRKEKRARSEIRPAVLAARDDDGFGDAADATYSINGQPACWWQPAAPDSNEQQPASDVMIGPDSAPDDEYDTPAAETPEQIEAREAKHRQEQLNLIFARAMQHPRFFATAREVLVAYEMGRGDVRQPSRWFAREDSGYAKLWERLCDYADAHNGELPDRAEQERLAQAASARGHSSPELAAKLAAPELAAIEAVHAATPNQHEPERHIICLRMHLEERVSTILQSALARYRTGRDIDDAMQQAQEDRRRIAEIGSGRRTPQIRFLDEMIDEGTEREPAVIGSDEPEAPGLLRRGEVGLLTIASKAGKTFGMQHLSFCIADGRPWLSFPTREDPVLHVDTELGEKEFRNRANRVAQQMGISGPEFRHIRRQVRPLLLRDSGWDVYRLIESLASIAPGEYAHCTIDSKYALEPRGGNENDNVAAMHFIRAVRSLATRCGMSVLMTHHPARGDMSGRDVRDVGAGAGAVIRAVDSHIIAREHADGGGDVYAVEAVLRSFPRLQPFCMRREGLLWLRADEHDPADLRRPASTAELQREVNDRRDAPRIYSVVNATGPAGMAFSAIERSTGIYRQRLRRLLATLVSEGALAMQNDRYITSQNQTLGDQTEEGQTDE